MSARGWLFTLNNPTDADKPDWPATVRYAIYSLEKGEQGTPHWQGYVEFTTPRQMPKTLLPRAHWERRKGTREQARAYCMKKESHIDGPWEHGLWEAGGQGRRSDLTDVADAILRGAPVTEVAEGNAETFIKYHRGVERLRQIVLGKTKRTWKTRLVVHWGKPGTGKTRAVYDAHKLDEIYAKEDGDWWDGYDGQPVVLIDDFYGGMRYSTFLRLTDRYPMQLPVKGAMVNFVAKTIYITSNVHPEEWYPNVPDKQALLRRIDEIKFFDVDDASDADPLGL